MSWPLAEAKNKFSEVVRLALEEGPQRVSRRNERVVVIAEKDLLKLQNNGASFKEFLLNSNKNNEIE